MEWGARVGRHKFLFSFVVSFSVRWFIGFRPGPSDFFFGTAFQRAKIYDGDAIATLKYDATEFYRVSIESELLLALDLHFHNGTLFRVYRDVQLFLFQKKEKEYLSRMGPLLFSFAPSGSDRAGSIRFFFNCLLWFFKKKKKLMRRVPRSSSQKARGFRF